MGYRRLVGPAELVDFVGFGLPVDLMTPVDFAASAVVDHVVIAGGAKAGVGREAIFQGEESLQLLKRACLHCRIFQKIGGPGNIAAKQQ